MCIDLHVPCSTLLLKHGSFLISRDIPQAINAGNIPTQESCTEMAWWDLVGASSISNILALAHCTLISDCEMCKYGLYF